MNGDLATVVRHARAADLDALVAVEQQAFAADRLSRRSLKRWLKVEHAALLVAERGHELLGYSLVWLHRGTQLARLYSLAVAAIARGTGLGRTLLKAAEDDARQQGYLFMRLEVSKRNESAIGLYESQGYRVFGEYSDYYEDHSSALRMHKQLQHFPAVNFRETPWYQQTTDFTCGPAALMMAMASLDASCVPCRDTELDVWREATTIFMTSGHGGCHPVGLGLAAMRRGFSAQVCVSTTQPLFVDGVRSEHKKNLIAHVHHQFVASAERDGVPIEYRDFTQADLQQWLQAGCAVIILVSTYRLDGRKTPHWVAVTGVDDNCIYVHDPDVEELNQLAIDCQYVPIARASLDKMSTFGVGKLRTAVVIRR